MKSNNLLMIVCFGLLAVAPVSRAADDVDLDVTMRVVGPRDSLPNAVTKTIALPPSASDKAKEKSASGLEKANEARSRGREYGQSVSEQARSKAKGKKPK